jgi:hypothetical protein
MPIVLGSEPSPYGDTPTPKCFGTVSPLDPRMFSSVVECAQTLLTGPPDARYSPIQVAQWVEDCVAASRSALEEARRTARTTTTPEFRRIEEDVLIQIGLGEFFAHKLRSAVLYEIWQKSGNAEAGRLAIEQYTQARDAWAAMAGRAGRVYRSDVSYGRIPKRRGHWSDRLPGIDTDLAALQAKVQSGAAPPPSAETAAAAAVRMATGHPLRPTFTCVHTPPQSFEPGQPLSLTLQVSAPHGETSPALSQVWYRHVDQAERWRSVRGAIPADYTQSPYALEYYFELRDGNGAVWMYPGFNETLSNQPYFTVSRRKS